MSKCPKSQCLISFVAVFAFMFLYDKVFHSCKWIMDQYDQTPQLWRTAEDMGQYFPWFFVRYGILTAVICCLYKKMCQCATTSCSGKPVNEGAGCCMKPGTCVHKRSMCFGAKIGVLIGTVQASSYIWMPISSSIALAWFGAAVVQGIGVGLILSFLCKKKECSNA